MQPVRMRIMTELGIARKAHLEVIPFKFHIRTNGIGYPVGQVDTGDIPVGTTENGADSEEPPGKTEIGNRQDRRERDAKSMEQGLVKDRRVFGTELGLLFRRQVGCEGLPGFKRKSGHGSGCASEGKGLVTDQLAPQVSGKLINDDDGDEKQQDDGNRLGRMTPTDR